MLMAPPPGSQLHGNCTRKKMLLANTVVYACVMLCWGPGVVMAQSASCLVQILFWQARRSKGYHVIPDVMTTARIVSTA